LRPDHVAEPLAPAELARYGRHLSLAEVGEAGQARLKAARVLLVGAGGLGSPLALYLAAAGVGTIGVLDDDVVEESNLQRQVAHGTSTLGRAKVESLRARLADLNPHVRLEAHAERLHAGNALAHVSAYDVVADGTDNFATRYLVNDACVLAGRPNVHGSVLRFEGQVGVFGAPGGPCYRCVFPAPPPAGVVPSCAEAGVLGVLPGVIGTLQATEVLKWLLGVGEPLVGRLMLYDALAASFREVRARRDPGCPVCGDSPTIRTLIEEATVCAAEPVDITAREVAALLQANDPSVVVVDVREEHELRIASIPGAVHLPLALVPVRMHELPRDRTVILSCHHGGRSMRALQFLKQQGFTKLRNLAGGIDAWSREVDPSVPRY
jgi:adenylyltransferase/sulfurtransferase